MSRRLPRRSDTSANYSLWYFMDVPINPAPPPPLLPPRPPSSPTEDLVDDMGSGFAEEAASPSSPPSVEQLSPFTWWRYEGCAGSYGTIIVSTTCFVLFELVWFVVCQRLIRTVINRQMRCRLRIVQITYLTAPPLIIVVRALLIFFKGDWFITRRLLKMAETAVTLLAALVAVYSLILRPVRDGSDQAKEVKEGGSGSGGEGGGGSGPTDIRPGGATGAAVRPANSESDAAIAATAAADGSEGVGRGLGSGSERSPARPLRRSSSHRSTNEGRSDDDWEAAEAVRCKSPLPQTGMRVLSRGISSPAPVMQCSPRIVPSYPRSQSAMI